MIVWVWHLAQAEEEEEQQLPADVTEGLGERLRSSLVLLDVNLPAIALPDGVHCRAFTGARPGSLRMHAWHNAATRAHLPPSSSLAP